MSWTYRVIKEGDEYGICEFYPDNGWTGMVAPVADSKEELRWVLERMLEAVDKGVICSVESTE